MATLKASMTSTVCAAVTIAGFISVAPLVSAQCVDTPKACINKNSSQEWHCVASNESCPSGWMADPNHANCRGSRRGCGGRDPTSFPPFKQAKPYEKCSLDSGPDDWHKAHPEYLMASTADLTVPKNNSMIAYCRLPLNTEVVRTYCTITQEGVHARNCPIEKNCPAVPFMQINWFFDTRYDPGGIRWLQVHANNWTDSIRTVRFVVFFRYTDDSKPEKLPADMCDK